MENKYTLNKHPDLEAMFDFLEGKLSEAETQAMEAHLLDCDACAAALEEMDRAGGPTNENRQKAAEFQEIFLSAPTPARRLRPGNRWNAFFRVAAMVLFALNLGWAAWYFSSPKGSAEFSPIPAETVRGNAPADLDVALLAYQKGRYEEAVGLLRALPDAPETVEIKLLYLGNALLALNRNEEAIVPLRRLCDNPEWTLYREQAQHYLGTAYLRLGKLPE